MMDGVMGSLCEQTAEEIGDARGGLVDRFEIEENDEGDGEDRYREVEDGFAVRAGVGEQE